MANEKISAMPALAGSALAVGDQFPVVHSATNKSITAADLAVGLGLGNFTIVGMISTDAGAILSNGTGTLAVAGLLAGSGGVSSNGSLSLDSGAITSDGSGHLTAISFVGSGASLTGLVASGFANQSANLAMVGPASGSAAGPSFRALVNADLPLGSAAVFALTSANRTTVNGTLTAVADLSIALVAGATYEFEAHLSVAASAVTGNQYGVNFSAAGSTVEAQISGTLAAASAQAGRISVINTASATFDTAGADGAIVIKGVIVTTSNAGNLTIQHLAVVATTTTATVYKNSVLKATRIA